VRFLKRFDQRALAWTGLMLLTILLAIQSWLILLLFSVSVATAIRFSLPDPGSSWQHLRGFYWFYLLNFIFILFFSGYPHSLLDWSAWLPAIQRAAFYTLRLVNIIALMLYLAHWLRAEELIMGFIGASTGRGVVARFWQRLLWTVLFAYHFLPLLRRDVQQMRMSVLARGMEFKGALTKRIRVYLAFMVPLLNSLFRRADALVTVLATRHFDPGSKRTMYRRFRMQPRDWTLATLATLLCSWVLI
jgi:energy-coupling factor transporter transmembrane protein EcfT